MSTLYMGETLLRQRFSLIPVRGSKDSSHPKAAAIGWENFQRRPPTLGQVAEWVQLKGWQLAIATGRVSGVVVIDFDSMALWHQFRIEHPHIVRDKPIVQTRKGIHLYIPVDRSSSSPIHNKHGLKDGLKWDVLGTGGYVIAPGSEINGHTYTVISGDLDQMPAPQPGQLKEILTWLQPAMATVDNTLSSGGALDKSAYTESIKSTSQPVLPGIGRNHLELIDAMRARFRAQMASGRNNALFSSLTWGRDRDLSDSDCMALLADFLKASPAHDAPAESERARMREFNATLRSAFSRPARPMGAAPARLPDSVRQALSRLKLMHIWRLLDSMFRAGLRPGQTITRKVALQLCGEQLGERNVWRALRDARFFQCFKGKGSPAPTPNAYGVETGKTTETTEKCFFSRYQNLQLNTHCNRGRPPHLYKIPSVDDVCQEVRIKTPRWSTAIQHGSSKAARMELYRAKISHKPGIYANAARAGWFGVCVNTIKSYDKALKIVRQPQYQEAPLSSWNIDGLPEPTMGHWLACDGKRYPTVTALAEKLMKYSRVSLVKQLPNYLCTADHLQQQKQAAIARTHAAAVPSVQPTIKPDIAAKLPRIAPVQKTYSKPIEPVAKPSYSSVQPDVPTIENSYPDDAMRALKRGWYQTVGSDWTVKSDRLELVQSVMPNAEDAMRDRHYTYLLDATPRRMLMWLRKRVGDPLYTRADVKKLYGLMGGEMTRKKAAAMFAEYGRAKTLRCAEFVAQRSDIANPPAYLITCLRADKRMAALLGGR